MDLATKSVFKGEFPLTAQFRSPPRNTVPSYDKFKELQFMPDGFPVDLQTNVLRLAPDNYRYANRFAKDNPSMLIMSTWRAASGNPKGKSAAGNGDPLGESVIEFPGHFVLSPGTQLAANISPSATTIQVQEGSKMVEGPALLVETDEDGDKVWENFEYVRIDSVSGNSVSVTRAFNGSPSARSFKRHKTYFAPMPSDFRVHAEYTDWFFNLSDDCPLDPLGRSAMDVILSEMVEPLRAGGDLDSIGGLDLASGPLVLNPENADYDVDGVADDPSVYRAGVRRFYERVWDVLGSNRVLTTELDYEMLGFINGVNQEGLARPNDPWKEVSRTVNDVLAWQQISDLPMVSITFVQYLNNAEELKRVQLHRLLNGYATCLGVAADVDDGGGLELLERDELFKGADKEPHWLGKSSGPLVRPALLTPNLLLDGTSTSSTDWMGMLDKLEALRADLVIDNGDLVIRPNGQGSGFVTLILNFPLTRPSDLTVYFEAISDDNTLVRHIKLPRINVGVETGGVRATISNITYVPVGYLLRRAESGLVKFDLRFEDGKDIRFRRLSVHAATDTLACEFDRGVVLVNPSLDDITLNLEQVFPHRTGYRRLTASSVSSALIDDKYMPQYNQAMSMNNGQPIGNPTAVHVSERNALFLIADDAFPTDPPSAEPTAFGQTISPTLYPSSNPTEDPCKDVEEKFELEQGVLVGCWYVQRFPSKTEKRCGATTFEGPPVHFFCPKSCDTCDVNDPPASSPTDNDKPTSATDAPENGDTPCEDLESKFELDQGVHVDCGWTMTIPDKRKFRCNRSTLTGVEVKDLCPRSCKVCISCDDSEDSFTLPSGASVRCSWTTTFLDKRSKRCGETTNNGVAVSSICPFSCDACIA